MSSNEEKNLLQQITYLSRLIKRHKSAGRPMAPSSGNASFHLVRNDKPPAVTAQPSCSYTYVRGPVASSSHHNYYQNQTSYTKQNNETQFAKKSVKNIIDHQTPSTSYVGHLNPTPKTILINPNFKKTEPMVVNVSNSNSSIDTSVMGLSCTTGIERPKTILLNPNFKGISKPKVHINTKFFDSLDTSKAQNCTEVSTTAVATSIPSSSSDLSNVISKNYSVKTNRKLVRDNTKPSSTATLKLKDPVVNNNPLITINKRKLVRMPAKSDKVLSEIKVHRITYKKSRASIQYKSKKLVKPKCMVFNKESTVKNIYKLKRSPKTLQPLTNSKYKFVRGAKDKSSNKFQLDRRLLQSRLKNVKKYSLKYESGSMQRRRSWQNATLNKKSLSQSPSSKIYRYRKSSTSSQGQKVSEFNIGGQKYVMDAKGKTLKRVAPEPSSSEASKKSIMSLLKRIHVAGVTYAAKAPNVFVRTNDHKTRTIVSQAKYKSISVLVNKLRKNNQPCVFYHRFGKCIRREKGTCPCVHDPKQIAICKMFLQGKCEVKGCLLSHDVRPEKMPTCQYFLDGCCVRDPCPYLHVKVSENAEVCKDFLNGFCSNSNNCKKKHVNVCPEVNRSGKCTKGKFCPYPHPKNSTEKRVHSLISKKTKKVNNTKVIDKEKGEEEEDSATRYYQKEASDGGLDENKSDVIDAASEESSEEIIKPLPSKRPKLGPLPSFIPI